VTPYALQPTKINFLAEFRKNTG